MENKEIVQDDKKKGPFQNELVPMIFFLGLSCVCIFGLIAVQLWGLNDLKTTILTNATSTALPSLRGKKMSLQPLLFTLLSRQIMNSSNDLTMFQHDGMLGRITGNTETHPIPYVMTPISKFNTMTGMDGATLLTRIP